MWLDTCKGDKRAINAKDEHDNFAICADFIDLDLYSLDDIECSLSSYEYTIETVKEIYGEDVNQIIAECLFEDDCLYDSHSISGVVAFSDIENIIQEYININ